MFLYCFEDETKEKLIKNGFKFINTKVVNNKPVHIFENNNKKVFSKEDKVYITNKLYF